MPAQQKTPERDELRRLLISGLSRADIARQYHVTHQAVQMAVRRHGLERFVKQPPKPDYSAYLPWGYLGGGWGDHYVTTMLRADAHEQTTGQPHPRLASRVAKFRQYMRDHDVVAVWHGPQIGFTLDPRRDGDWELVRPTDPDGQPLLDEDGEPLREPERRYHPT